MRRCPTCQSEYPDGVTVCARDGALLALAAASAGAANPGPAVLDDAPTLPFLPALTTASPAISPAATFSPMRPLAMPAVEITPAVVPATPAAAAPAASPAESAQIFDSLVGATLAGRYLIIRRIGEGGMGAVYEAKHTIIGKRVAVKVLLEKFLTKSDFVARLLQEARLASAIGHEHIVDVTDFGTTDDGRAFVAMEFLDGESLAQLVMREAPLPVERSLRITRQVASALGAAHAKGIVHRDVKPENVYLIRRGDADFVKVVDFGISKAVKQGQGDDGADYRLTHTGLLLGTPLYMSPEQARGDEDLDHRVDVWAMGVMLYECLTGEVPFRANNYLGIISQVLTHTAVPPSTLRPELGIPEAVEAVVMRAMEKDRSRRYALMADVEQDLERLLAGDQNVGAIVTSAPSTAPPPRGPARGRMLVWGAAVAALIAGVAMVLARPEPVPRTAAQQSPRAAATSARATAQPAPVVPAVASPPTAPGLTDTQPSIGAAAVLPAPTTAADVRRRRQDAAGSEAAGPNRLDDPAARRAARRRMKAALPARAAALPVRPAHKSPKPDDPEIRGVLPSRSGEGYPDN